MTTAFGCVNNTIRLRSERYFDLANPQPDQFTFADIAGALSKLCRFGGHCSWFYSVAEHCWHCCQQADDDGLPLDAQQAILLHDAAEAFVGDMVKPLKIMLPGYAEIEKRIADVIEEKFGVEFKRNAHSIRKIDHEMLIAERRGLFTRDTYTWAGEHEVRPLRIEFGTWDSARAESEFTKLAQIIGLDTNA